VHDVLRETTPFGKLDALCLARWVESGVLVQPVVAIVERMSSKQAVVAPVDDAFGSHAQSFRHFLKSQQAFVA